MSQKLSGVLIARHVWYTVFWLCLILLQEDKVCNQQDKTRTKTKLKPKPKKPKPKQDSVLASCLEATDVSFLSLSDKAHRKSTAEAKPQ